MNYSTIFKEYPSIISAYLFGSRARGNFSKISDYDFAIQIDESKLPKRKYTDLKLDLIGGLSKALKTDNIDIVILNDAPLLLKHRILRDRKVLYCKSQLKRVRLEAKILIDYLDEKEYEMAFAKGTFKRILEGA